MNIKDKYEKHHKVIYTEEAIDEAVKLSVKYITDKKLPDKAIDLIDLACSRFKVNNVTTDRIVGAEEIKFEFYKKLSSKEKVYFEHRVAVFLKKYPFFGKEGMVITEEVKVLIAATAIMLTFGMRSYLFTVIDKIIVICG